MWPGGRRTRRRTRPGPRWLIRVGAGVGRTTRRRPGRAAIRVPAKGESMKHVIGVVFVLASPLLLRADDKDEVYKELKALEGKWKAVAMEAGGTPLPKDGIPDFTFTVAAGG